MKGDLQKKGDPGASRKAEPGNGGAPASDLPTRLMTVPDVAETLRISSSELYKLCEERLVPFRRIGRGRGRIRFTSEDLSAIIAKAFVEPAEPKEALTLD